MNKLYHLHFFKNRLRELLLGQRFSNSNNGKQLHFISKILTTLVKLKKYFRLMSIFSSQVNHGT